MKVRKMEHQRLRARYCSLLLLLRGSLRECVCALCSLAVMRRVSIDATGVVQCVRGRAVGVRVVRSHAPGPRVNRYSVGCSRPQQEQAAQSNSFSSSPQRTRRRQRC